VAIPYEVVLAQESEEMQLRVKQLAAEMIAEELSLREMRRVRKLTQSRLSKKLKIGQEGVSRIEKRTDLYLSTLRSYVEGVGGELTLMVKFPDRPPVILAGLGENVDEKKAQIKAKKKAGNPAQSKAVTRRAA
jgi:DNA-binding XRE family transcriptional regulator